jgi:hypothetical protein
MHFGTAVRDITPSYPVWLHGYAAREHPSQGILEPISLSCLAVSNGAETVLLFSCDMIGIHSYVCDRLYALLERRVGIAPPRIMLSCSHTHFAPALHDMRYLSPHLGIVEPDPRFVEEFEQKLVEAAEESLRNLREGRLETARLPVPQVVFNRRTVQQDGTVETNFRYPPNAQDYAFSPIDSQLTILRIVDDMGVRAAWLNFGCHPVTGGPDRVLDHYDISSDYAYYLRQAVGASWHCPALFALGGAGDAVPMDRYGASRQRIGGILGNAAVLGERVYAVDECADLIAEVMHMEAETIIEVDPATAETEYEEAQSELLALDQDSDVTEESEAYQEATARFEAKVRAYFRARLYPENQYAIPIQFLKIGQTTLVGLPFEVLSEFSRRMKERFPHSVLCSCTGGYQGYLSFAYEYERGGYEATAASTHFVPGTADDLLEAVLTKLGTAKLGGSNGSS